MELLESFTVPDCDNLLRTRKKYNKENCLLINNLQVPILHHVLGITDND